MKTRLITALLCLPVTAWAAPPSLELDLPPLGDDARLELPAIDHAKALAQDAQRAKSDPGPVRYAIGHAIDSVDASAAKSAHGQWTTLPDGRALWQLEIHAPGAASIDLGFDRFRLPAGAELWVVDRVGDGIAGPFTDADNPASGEFWTPLLRTDTVRIELTVPQQKRAFLQLSLDTVHHGYKDLLGGGGLAKSGSCNVDVVCPEGNEWRDEIRSVAVVAYNASGTRDGNGCSGQFMNSTGPSSGPLFLSANHCEINAASARVYFNFQNSTCRTPGSAASGQDGNGALTVSLFGATMLAQTNPAGDVVSSDFALLRFTNPAPTAAQLYLSGWDRRDLAPSAVTGIHHPDGDEKRISFENDPLTIAAYSGPTGSGTTHLRVADWDLGTTERGSSGSGIWNNDGRLVGVLSGGEAACGNNGADWYGRLAHAWEGLGSSDRRLRDWLDNANTGASTLDGKNACQIQLTLDSPAFGSAPAAGSNVTFTTAVSGHTGAVTYSWDVDGDGVTDRTSSDASVTLTYPKAESLQVRVGAIDAAGCVGNASRALDVAGPVLAATAAAPQQVCGDNDAAIEPGERWKIPVTLRNTGAVALPAGARALFAPGAASTGVPPIGPNSFGHLAGTSAQGVCSYDFLDIAAGANQVPALTTVEIDNEFGPLDDARTRDDIVLGGAGFRFYGQTYTRAVMSTNGYVSFATAETGGDFSNDCDGGYNNGAAGPQLRVLHDDLVVSEQTGAGLRYRYFASCPRSAESDRAQAQGCHVFQWTHMQLYNANGTALGDFEFEAIAYERTGQVAYQYRSAAPNAGATATIGVSNVAGDDPLNTGCDSESAAPAQSAVCVFDPAGLPTSSSGLRLETPTLAVSALAPAAQTTVEVPIAVASNASCGAPLALDYIGSAASTSFSLDTRPVLTTTVGGGGSCQATTSCPVAIPAIATRPGFYFSGARSGNGLANFVYGEVFGGVWYSALSDRSPTWYILNGDYKDHLGTMPILRFRNSAAPSGFAPLSSTVGRAWVAQVDADSLMYAWTLEGGKSGAELLDATPLPFTNPNHTQTWYATSQSGWGLSIESLLTSPTTFLEFIVGYIYDDAGTARWVLGTSDNVTGGALDVATYAPHCPACPRFNDWEAASRRAAGSMSRTYTGPVNATFNSTITLPAPLSGSWNRTNLPLTTIGPPQQP